MELWTPEHARTILPALALMLLVAWGLRAWLGKKTLSVRMIPLQIATCILLVLEVGKQVLSIRKGYDLYHLPFHYCSLFIFVMPLMAFYRGKHRHKVTTVATAICAAMFLLLMIYPNLIYSAANIREFFTNYFSFHTVAYHNVVMFILILILALDLHAPGQAGERAVVMVFMVCFCAVSATMAQLLQTNFANYYSCNIPPLQALCDTVATLIGPVVTKIIYILIVSGLNIVFTWGAYLLCRLAHKYAKLT